MAHESGTPLSAEEMIQPADLMQTVRWLLSLSPAACVKEIMIERRAPLDFMFMMIQVVRMILLDYWTGFRRLFFR
jgi:hypothetical protein